MIFFGKASDFDDDYDDMRVRHRASSFGQYLYGTEGDKYMCDLAPDHVSGGTGRFVETLNTAIFAVGVIGIFHIRSR